MSSRTLAKHSSIKFLLLAFLLAGNSGIVFSQKLFLPENPLKGRLVFEQKGCINCHSIKGDGGSIGPDLGRTKFYGSFLELAAIMLNHAQEMLRQTRELDIPFPEFSRTEMAELVAYLYYLRYLGEPGDLYRGKLLVKKKGCLNCHSINNNGGSSAPAFDNMSKYYSPLFLAQILWNHGPKMAKQIREKGWELPKFDKGEIGDLSAYLRSASKGTEIDKVYMSPGSPLRGKAIFSKKGCIKCHGSGKNRESNVPDLASIELNLSVTDIAGLMWNHSYDMGLRMMKKNIEWPRFTGQEMADVIAYLYFIKFEDPPGDSNSGQSVFESKGCIVCHSSTGGSANIAPDLSKSKGLSSTIEMARIMWNHTPDMEAKIVEKVMQWPHITGKDMRDIYAYLKLIQSKK